MNSFLYKKLSEFDSSDNNHEEVSGPIWGDEAQTWASFLPLLSTKHFRDVEYSVFIHV